MAQFAYANTNYCMFGSCLSFNLSINGAAHIIIRSARSASNMFDSVLCSAIFQPIFGINEFNRVVEVSCQKMFSHNTFMIILEPISKIHGIQHTIGNFVEIGLSLNA